MLLRSLHSKSFRYCKSKYFSHFHSFCFKHGWSIFLNPFTSKLAPQKSRSDFSIRFQPRWNDTATAQWCIQPPQRSQKQDAVMWCQGFSCCLYFFWLWRQDRRGGLVSEMFGLFTLILWGDPIYFSDGWLNHQVEDRDWQFSAALQIVWVKLVFSRAFFAEIIDLFLLWHWFCDCYDGETRFNSRVGWGEGVSLFRGSSTWLFFMGFLGFLLVCL